MINILGLLHHAEGSEARPAQKAFDADFLVRHARLYEDCGFDRVLIGQNARAPDSLSIAGFIAGKTSRLKFMIAHRPGLVAPTMAARQFATLDRMSGGRCAAHITTASNDQETQGDGDFLTKDERYERSLEYVDVMRRVWSSDAPFDHEGPFYSFKGAFSTVRPTGGAVPVFWGGQSEKGVAYGAACADVYAMGGATLARTAELVGQVRDAAPAGRNPKFLMSMRVIMAPTEAEAWARAYAIRDAIEAFQAAGGSIGRDKGETGKLALAEAAALADARQTAAGQGPDPCLWTGLTVSVKARTHVTALVGSPDQLAGALMRYYDLGVSEFILTGFEPLEDTRAIGRDLIPRVKAAVGAAHAA